MLIHHLIVLYRHLAPRFAVTASITATEEGAPFRPSPLSELAGLQLSYPTVREYQELSDNRDGNIDENTLCQYSGRVCMRYVRFPKLTPSSSVSLVKSPAALKTTRMLDMHLLLKPDHGE